MASKTTLKGCYILFGTKESPANNQGQIMEVLEKQVVIDRFSWIDGKYTDSVIVQLDYLTPQNHTLFRNKELFVEAADKSFKTNKEGYNNGI